MGPSDIMAKVYFWAHPVMSTIYAQWADVGFAEIFGKLSHRFYRPLRQRVRHGLDDRHIAKSHLTHACKSLEGELAARAVAGALLA